MSFEQAAVLARVEVQSSGTPPVRWLSSFVKGEMLYDDLVLRQSCRKGDPDLLDVILQPSIEQYL
jgi:hypothetical protein